jgi:hypothetical protein
MKKYFLLCYVILLIIGCNGATNYPLTVEFRVDGDSGTMFYGYCGDTLGDGEHLWDVIVPQSYFLELENDTDVVMIRVNLAENYDNCLLTVNLYVDEEFVEADTITRSYEEIMMFYPPYSD